MSSSQRLPPGKSQMLPASLGGTPGWASGYYKTAFQQVPLCWEWNVRFRVIPVRVESLSPSLCLSCVQVLLAFTAGCSQCSSCLPAAKLLGQGAAVMLSYSRLAESCDVSLWLSPHCGHLLGGVGSTITNLCPSTEFHCFLLCTFCCGKFFLLVFMLSLLLVTLWRVAILVCPWEEMSSGSSNPTILTAPKMLCSCLNGASLVGLLAMNPPATHESSIPGLGRSPGGG